LYPQQYAVPPVARPHVCCTPATSAVYASPPGAVAVAVTVGDKVPGRRVTVVFTVGVFDTVAVTVMLGVLDTVTVPDGAGVLDTVTVMVIVGVLDIVAVAVTVGLR